MIVHKFGGTSVGDAGRFANVAQIIIDHQHREGAPSGGVAVVVSAMKGVTNALIAGARAAAEGEDAVYREIKAALLSKHLEVVGALLGHSPERLDVGGLVEDRLHELERLYRSIAVLGELTVRGCDAVASLGEQLSSSILAAVLRDRGVRAQAVSATELIVTDDNFGAANPLIEPTRQRLRQRVAPLVERGVIPVITGYIAATEQGITTTLGRNCSDYTAALVGAGLGADEVWIWSDVNGILTADPNIVPQARTLSELSYAEAAELAYYGADVLQPKTLRAVTEGRISLRIVNSFDPAHPGTLIVGVPSADRERLPAIISTTGLSMIAVGTEDDSWTLDMSARVLQILSEVSVDVLMFSQSFSEHNLNLVVREQDQAHCLNALCREFGGDPGQPVGRGSERITLRRLGNGCSLGTQERVATVSVVGVPGWGEAGIVPHAFAALGECGTRVIAVAQAASEYSASFCVPEDQVAEAVRYLHHKLGLEG
ncbi:MAG: aspartate kinase [Anaerolineae bacterium]|nr:aspartate kinase [Anaerolineae bacterium]